MQLLSEVVGALAAGALVLVVARQVGAGHERAFGAVAVVPIAVAAVLALPALRDGAQTLLDKRKENPPLTAAEAALKPGADLGLNVDFLAWAKEHFAEGDTFHLEIGAIPEETYNAGVGIRQAAILQWGMFQLAPFLAFEQSSKARDLKSGEGRNADWLVFYEMDPAEYPAAYLGEAISYAPGFAIARSKLAG